MITPTHRAYLAAYQGIRGGPEKTLGKVLARAFGATHSLDLSSGDLPKCIPSGGFFKKMKEAARAMPEGLTAYDHGAYLEAQDAIAHYLSGNSAPDKYLRTQVVGGISSVMGAIVEHTAIALGYNPEADRPLVPCFIICPPIHPNWLSAIVEQFGYGAIRTIKRTAQGYPDLEDARQVFRSINRPFVYIATPHENPSGRATPLAIYHNSEGSGILDLIKGVTTYGFFVWDAIYKDLAWGPHATTAPAFLEAIAELEIRAPILHSLSKAFMVPGWRIGGMYYAGPMDEYGRPFCDMMQVEADNRIANGISSLPLPALRVAYSDDPETQADRQRVVAIVQEHVTQNQAFLANQNLPHVFPEATIDTAFYGFHRVGGFDSQSTGSLPWADSLYQERLIQAITGKMDGRWDPRDESRWRNFLTSKGAYGLSASRAFHIELAMNGLMALPHDPFYPVFANDQWDKFEGTPKQPDDREAIVTRLILAHEPSVVQQAVGIMRRVWNEAVDSYESGSWQNRYR